MKAYGWTEMNIYTNKLGHMAKLVAIPLYDRNL